MLTSSATANKQFVNSMDEIAGSMVSHQNYPILKKAVADHLQVITNRNCRNCMFAMMPQTDHTLCDHHMVKPDTPENFNFIGCGYWASRV